MRKLVLFASAAALALTAAMPAVAGPQRAHDRGEVAFTDPAAPSAAGAGFAVELENAPRRANDRGETPLVVEGNGSGVVAVPENAPRRAHDREDLATRDAGFVVVNKGVAAEPENAPRKANDRGEVPFTSPQAASAAGAGAGADLETAPRRAHDRG